MEEPRWKDVGARRAKQTKHLAQCEACGANLGKGCRGLPISAVHIARLEAAKKVAPPRVNRARHVTGPRPR